MVKAAHETQSGATKEIELFVTKCARQIWSSASAEVQAQLKVGGTCPVPGRRHFLPYSMHFRQSAGPSTEKKKLVFARQVRRKKIGYGGPGTEEKNALVVPVRRKTIARGHSPE